MSDTYPVQASALRKGGHMMINAHPCKILSMTTSKTGKHGHAKITFTGMNIFLDTKHITNISSTHNVDVPRIYNDEFQLIDIDEDGYLSLMDDDGETRQDLKMPSDTTLAESIRKAFDQDKDIMVNVLKAMGQERIVSFKELR